MGWGWEQVPNWECFFAHRKQGLCLSVYVDDVKMIGRMKNMVRIVEQVDNKRWSWRTYIISWPILGMFSTWMQLERKHYWGVQKDVRVTNLNHTRKQLFGLVMWRVMRRNVWEDIANWQIKKLSFTSRVSTPCLGDHQFKKGRIGNGWRVFKILLPHRLEMLICGPNC